MNKRYRPFINKEDGNSTKESMSLHHIMPTSRDGSESYDNKIMLYNSVHDALHRLFGNGTIKEQLEQLLFINGKSLSSGFREDIHKVLSESDNKYYYKDGILLPKQK